MSRKIGISDEVQGILIEDSENGRVAYDSLVISKLDVFKALSNELSLKIIKELARSPASPIDIARRLKVHEQKVYYYMRKLEKAGIIYSVSSERRHGMIAKIYSAVSPVVAAKLFEKGVEVKENISLTTPQNILDFFYPFIEGRKLNALVVVGDPSPHGRFEEYARDGVHVIDFAIFFGTLLTNFNSPSYKLDVEVDGVDKEKNLILIGNPRTNMLIDEIRENLPIKFDLEKERIITTNGSYNDPRIGVIIKCISPFNKTKRILIFSGLRSRGIKSAILAITKYTDETLKTFKDNDYFIRVVEGLDCDGDKIIDDIKFIE